MPVQSTLGGRATSEQTTVGRLVDDYMFRHINLDVPDWYINPDHKALLGSAEGASICAATPLTYAPGLLDVLQADTPPSPNFFMTTPTVDGKSWAVYAALLTKDGCDPALYIGSGTDALCGHRKRVAVYHDKENRMLPCYVRALYDGGFDLAHVGLLCWAPIPSPEMVQRARLRFLAVEGTLTNLFFSVIPTCMDDFWADIVPWCREDVVWRSTNSHTALQEGVGDGLNLSEEQLRRREDDRKRRSKERSKKAYVKNTQAMRAQYDLERARDIDAFRLKKRIQAASWTAKNRPKAREGWARGKKKALAERRFYCETCQRVFADSSKLARHNKSTLHKNKSEGVPPTAKALERQAYSARVIADRTFHCAPCNQLFNCASRLEAHNSTRKHLDKHAAVIASQQIS
ncbi:hypothetical protein LTS18_010196 [Coniosporium uncinatum]|uniref:Uncharacterized protein n=1 Tax=Coniosporium uncinatum TaxID=93489 RepID=A0ACC3DLC2_9PEZI|nr:hypothetical protein LTS18_010196 [Coniosporium uncinatum]